MGKKSRISNFEQEYFIRFLTGYSGCHKYVAVAGIADGKK